MNYIKSLSGVMELDYKTRMGTDIPYLDTDHYRVKIFHTSI